MKIGRELLRTGYLTPGDVIDRFYENLTPELEKAGAELLIDLCTFTDEELLDFIGEDITKELPYNYIDLEDYDMIAAYYTLNPPRDKWIEEFLKKKEILDRVPQFDAEGHIVAASCKDKEKSYHIFENSMITFWALSKLRWPPELINGEILSVDYHEGGIRVQLCWGGPGCEFQFNDNGFRFFYHNWWCVDEYYIDGIEYPFLQEAYEYFSEIVKEDDI